jgi:hypothetical protein
VGSFDFLELRHVFLEDNSGALRAIELKGFCRLGVADEAINGRSSREANRDVFPDSATEQRDAFLDTSALRLLS